MSQIEEVKYSQSARTGEHFNVDDGVQFENSDAYIPKLVAAFEKFEKSLEKQKATEKAKDDKTSSNIARHKVFAVKFYAGTIVSFPVNGSQVQEILPKFKQLVVWKSKVDSLVYFYFHVADAFEAISKRKWNACKDLIEAFISSRSLTKQVESCELYNSRGASPQELIKRYALHGESLLQMEPFVGDLTADQVDRINSENDQLTDFRTKFQVDFGKYLANYVAMPTTIDDELVLRVQGFTATDFYSWVRKNRLDVLWSRVTTQAFNSALQKHNDHPILKVRPELAVASLNKATMIRQFLNVDSGTKMKEQWTYNFMINRPEFKLLSHVPVIHPHPMAVLSSRISQFIEVPCRELIHYPAAYLRNFILISKWITNLILTNEASIQSNNCACLFLNGKEGTGKSEVIHTLETAFTIYKYAVNNKFQSADITDASLISIEEADPVNLVTGEFKELLDYNSSVKTQLKFGNPFDVSRKVPIVLSSNHDIIKIWQEQQIQKKNTTNNSLGAVIRRLFLVCFDTQLQRHFPAPSSAQLAQEPRASEAYAFHKKLNRVSMFNTLFAMAVLLIGPENEMHGLDYCFHKYIDKVVCNFARTHWGQMMIKNIDFIRSHVHDEMLKMHSLSYDNEHEQGRDSPFSKYLTTVVSQQWYFGSLAKDVAKLQKTLLIPSIQHDYVKYLLHAIDTQVTEEEWAEAMEKVANYPKLTGFQLWMTSAHAYAEEFDLLPENGESEEEQYFWDFDAPMFGEVPRTPQKLKLPQGELIELGILGKRPIRNTDDNKAVKKRARTMQESEEKE